MAVATVTIAIPTMPKSRRMAISAPDGEWPDQAVGPRDTTEPTAWRTDIGWPVFRVSAR